jgi:serine protease Do
MRNIVVGVLAVPALLVALAGVGDAAAQGRTRAPRAPAADLLMFEAGGSSIGASVRDLRDEEIATAKLAQPGGVLVEDVREGGPAARAGLRSGDIVVEFDGERVRSARHFTRLVRETAPGRSVRGSVTRDGSRREVTIAPEAGADRLALAMPDIGRSLERGLRGMPRNFDFDLDPPDLPRGPFRPSERGRLGVSLTPLSEQLATYFGVAGGVLVSSVAMDSPAARAGLRAGDVITMVAGRQVTSAADVANAVRTAPGGAALDVRVMREKKQVELEVTLPEREVPAGGLLPV